MNGFKTCIALFLLVCTSCGDDSINYPEKYNYSNIEMDDCLFVVADDLGGLEVDVTSNLRLGFRSLVRSTLQELVDVPGSGLFDCIELLDETTAKVSATVNGEILAVTGEYNMDKGILTVSGENIILENNGDNLEFYLQAYLILPGPNGTGSPLANIANYDTHVASPDIWENFNQLNLEYNFITGDTVALCLPRLVYKK